MAQVQRLDAAEKLTLPLSLYETAKVATLEGNDGTPFTIVAGLDETLVAKLKKKSLDKSDTELVKGTSDYKRFGEGSYEAWFEKGRIPFAAVTDAGNLAAVIWFGKDEPPELTNGYAFPDREWETIAFRSYAPYRGVGIMTPMSMFVAEMHDQTSPERRLWLEVNVDNEAAKHLYHKLGFVEVGNSVRNGRLVMTRNA